MEQKPSSVVWQLGVTAALLAATGALALRARDSLALRLFAVEAAAVATTIAGAASIRGYAMYYLIYWARSVGMLLTALPFIVMVRNRATLLDRLPRRLVRAGTLVAVVLSVAYCEVHDKLPDERWTRIHVVVAKVALEKAPSGPVRVVAVGPRARGSACAIAGALEWRGHVAKLPPFYANGPGDHRTVDPSVRMPTFVLSSGMISVDDFLEQKDAQLLYLYEPLAPEQRALARRLRAELAPQFVSIHREFQLGLLDGGEDDIGPVPTGVDSSKLGRYVRLAGGDDKVPFALFLLPAGAVI